MKQVLMKCVAGLVALNFLAPVSADFDLMDLIAADQDRLAREGFFYQDDNKPPSVLGQPQKCVDNKLMVGEEEFDCSNVDFYSFLSLGDLEIPELGHQENLFRSMDIWGWVSPTGREFTLICLDNGAAIIDSTDPLNPCIIAKLPTGRYIDRWGDIKVHNNTMYHVKDRRRPGDDNATRFYGIEVYDLLEFDKLECSATFMGAPYFSPHFVFTGHGRSHNLVVNTESGRLYSVGTEFCAGGFMILDVSKNRLEPEFLGCADADGYTHDGQCVTYDGPDPNFQGKEICFGFNTDSLTIWDLTVASNPIMISRTEYENSAYTHQGWTNNDMTKILLDDELDEWCNQVPQPSSCDNRNLINLTGLQTTSTVVFDISDLAKPIYEGAFIHKDLAIDHNLYVWGIAHRKGWGGNPPMEYYPDPNFAYLHNYLAGLRILDIHSSDIADWTEAGYFDVSPDRTEVAFAGSWSGYLHPSGVYAVSSIERGLFLLQPKMVFTEDFPQAPPENNLLMILAVFALVLVVIALLVLVAMMGRSVYSAQAAKLVGVEPTENKIKPRSGAPIVEDS